MRAKKLWSVDAETDPFQHGRVPEPFVWGAYDGKRFLTFDTTDAFIEFFFDKPVILYAHNGGKFDYMFLIKYLKETRVKIIGGRIAQMYLGKAELRDSYSAVPVPLRDVQKLDIEYWKLEKEHRTKHRDEIIEYLRVDCVTLYDLMDRYREVAGKQLTIASNALKFSKALGIDPGKSNARFDENMRRFYFGGRTECLQPGTHKDLTVLDIHSAYPFAMSHDHATGTEFAWRNNFRDMTEDQINRAFIRLSCYSNGAFPKRVIGPGGGLSFPRAHDEYFVTGWEYNTAKRLNLIADEKIISVAHTAETITFDKYVQHWYKFKSDNPKAIDPINYTIGKIMMNSLYGKLAQNPTRYFDYKIVPGGTKICREFVSPSNDNICQCGSKDVHHGWELGPEFDNLELHYREAMWIHRFKHGADWKGKNLFNNVATGASITGFTRAHLLTAMHTVGFDKVIYCDTDSIICHTAANHAALPQSAALGDWENEGQISLGHFAGKKLYGLTMEAIDKKTGKPKIKIASKGSKLEFEDIVKILKGETVVWKSEAPSFSINSRAKIPTAGVDPASLFIVRNIRSTAIAPSLSQ